MRINHRENRSKFKYIVVESLMNFRESIQYTRSRGNMTNTFELCLIKECLPRNYRQLVNCLLLVYFKHNKNVFKRINGIGVSNTKNCASIYEIVRDCIVDAKKKHIPPQSF